MRDVTKNKGLDARVKPTVFNVMADLLERGVIKETDIKKPLYSSEYKRIKAVK